MGKWSDDSVCGVVHDVQLYGALDTVVISGNDICCSVVFDTLVGVCVFSVMWSELLIHLLLVVLCGHQCSSARERSVRSHLR